MLLILTILVLVEVAAANSAPLDGYQDFMFSGLRLWYINNADIFPSKELRGFHDASTRKSVAEFTEAVREWSRLISAGKI
jgi:hypothetical protein